MDNKPVILPLQPATSRTRLGPRQPQGKPGAKHARLRGLGGGAGGGMEQGGIIPCRLSLGQLQAEDKIACLALQRNFQHFAHFGGGGNDRKQAPAQPLGLGRGNRQPHGLGLARLHRLCAAIQPGIALQLFKPGQHSGGIGGDMGGQRAIFMRGRAKQLLLDDLGKALNGIYRRAQFMQQLTQAIGFGVGSHGLGRCR